MTTPTDHTGEPEPAPGTRAEPAAEPERAGAPGSAAGIATPAAAAEPAEPAPVGPAVPRTRTGSAWTALVAAVVVLVLLLVFILENLQRVRITYFGATGHLPLGVALLLAAAGGALLAAILGVGRMLQLRRVARRHQREAVRARR